MTDRAATTDDDDDDQPHPGALTTAPQPRANQIARADFSGTSLAMGNQATDALVAQARAMTEARWIMAMRAPRNIDVVRQDVLAECRVPGFAEVATYARPVGKEQDENGDWVDKFVEGLSIRFAEVAMRCMGNMQCKATTIYDDPRSRIITVFAVDYQTNATWETDLTIPKTVERRKLKRGQKPIGERVNSYGDRVFIVEATDQDVKTVAAAEISKASRTAILRLVPGQLQDEAFEVCKKIQADKNAKDPNAARRGMLDAFASVGVRPPALEQYLGHSLDSMSPAERDQLIQVGKSIKEGDLVWAEVLEERLSDRAKRAAKAPVPVTRAETAPAAGPATTAPAAAAPAPQAVATAQPAAVPATAPTPTPSTSAGKGTAALKGALTSKPKPAAPAPAAPAPPPAEPAAKPYLEIPPDLGPPGEGQEYRACAKCSAVVEVPKDDPTGAMCYACNAAMRDE